MGKKWEGRRNWGRDIEKKWRRGKLKKGGLKWEGGKIQRTKNSEKKNGEKSERGGRGKSKTKKNKERLKIKWREAIKKVKGDNTHSEEGL